MVARRWIISLLPADLFTAAILVPLAVIGVAKPLYSLSIKAFFVFPVLWDTRSITSSWLISPDFTRSSSSPAPGPLALNAAKLTSGSKSLLTILGSRSVPTTALWIALGTTLSMWGYRSVSTYVVCPRLWSAFNLAITSLWISSEMLAISIGVETPIALSIVS